MTNLKILVFSAGLVFATGCATNGWQAEKIPVPRGTPYDSNQLARNAYLEGFRQGYRAQSRGGATAVETLSGPFLEAQRQGFYAGAAQARAEGSPEQPLR